MKYRTLNDGEWSAESRFHKISCCDCCLVHVVEIAKGRNGFKIRAWRDNRATANKRRVRKVKVIEHGKN